MQFKIFFQLAPNGRFFHRVRDKSITVVSKQIILQPRVPIIISLVWRVIIENEAIYCINYSNSIFHVRFSIWCWWAFTTHFVYCDFSMGISRNNILSKRNKIPWIKHILLLDHPVHWPHRYVLIKIDYSPLTYNYTVYMVRGVFWYSLLSFSPPCSHILERAHFKFISSKWWCGEIKVLTIFAVGLLLKLDSLLYNLTRYWFTHLQRTAWRCVVKTWWMKLRRWMSWPFEESRKEEEEKWLIISPSNSFIFSRFSGVFIISKETKAEINSIKSKYEQWTHISHT